MSKLELKHIAPYLPYVLEVLGPDNITILKVLEISFDGIISVGENAPKYCNIKGVKPILRPINSITKEEARELINTIFNCEELTSVEVNGDEVVIEGRFSYDLMPIKLSIDGVWTYLEVDEMTGDLSTNYLVYEYLFKHHFDVFGLIEKGLAIDKNIIE